MEAKLEPNPFGEQMHDGLQCHYQRAENQKNQEVEVGRFCNKFYIGF